MRITEESLRSRSPNSGVLLLKPQTLLSLTSKSHTPTHLFKIKKKCKRSNNSQWLPHPDTLISSRARVSCNTVVAAKISVWYTFFFFSFQTIHYFFSPINCYHASVPRKRDGGVQKKNPHETVINPMPSLCRCFLTPD